MCNIGIGVGEWDDYLGYLIEGRGHLTSIDIDPQICAALGARQMREAHPNPAQIICADIIEFSSTERFDMITVVGSTLAETTDPDACLRAASRLLEIGGQLLLLTVGQATPSLHEADLGLRELRRERDETLSDLPISLILLGRT